MGVEAGASVLERGRTDIAFRQSRFQLHVLAFYPVYIYTDCSTTVSRDNTQHINVLTLFSLPSSQSVEAQKAIRFFDLRVRVRALLLWRTFLRLELKRAIQGHDVWHDLVREYSQLMIVRWQLQDEVLAVHALERARELRRAHLSSEQFVVFWLFDFSDLNVILEDAPNATTRLNWLTQSVVEQIEFQAFEGRHCEGMSMSQ